MTSTDQFSAERVADRAEILHRVNQFCRAVDRLDLEELYEVFHPDGYDDHGVFKGDPDGFIGWVRDRHQTIAFSSHHLSNVYIDFTADDEAFVESYFLIWQSVTPSANILGSDPDAAPFEMLSSGRYADRFTQRDDRWRIASRTVIPGSSTRVDTVASDWAAAGFPAYSRDTQDNAQQLRSMLRASA